MNGLAVALVCLGLTATQPQAPLEALFDEGVMAYTAQDYRSAVEAWDKLVQFGVADSALEQNLGSAYFRVGDRGRAVLHWERALRLDPSDARVRQNLRRVRQEGREPSPIRDLADRTLDRFSSLVDVDDSAIFVVAAVNLLGVVLVVARLAGPNRRRWARTLAFVVSLASLTGALNLGLQLHTRLASDRAVILSERSLSRGPGREYGDAAVLPAGTAVRIGRCLAGWCEVESDTGAGGWIETDGIAEIAERRRR